MRLNHTTQYKSFALYFHAWLIRCFPAGQGIGYVQGLNIVAAVFLYVMPELDAFNCIREFVLRHCPLYYRKVVSAHPRLVLRHPLSLSLSFSLVGQFRILPRSGRETLYRSLVHTIMYVCVYAHTRNTELSPTMTGRWAFVCLRVPPRTSPAPPNGCPCFHAAAASSH